jgi:hypothetical protein
MIHAPHRREPPRWRRGGSAWVNRSLDGSGLPESYGPRKARKERATMVVTSRITAVIRAERAVRSPTAIRKHIDELRKRLRRRVANAEADADMQDFIARAFHGGDVGGHA